MHSLKNNYIVNTHVTTTEIKKQNTARTTETRCHVSHCVSQSSSPEEVVITLTYKNSPLFLTALPNTVEPTKKYSLVFPIFKNICIHNMLYYMLY